MIRLKRHREPYWLDLGDGVRVKVRPLTTAIYEMARAKSQREAQKLAHDQVRATEAGGMIESIPDLGDPDAMVGVSQMLFAKALARAGIIEWRGVLVDPPEGGAWGEDLDHPAGVNDETVGALMEVPRIAEAFVVVYSKPVLDQVKAGNVSGSVRSGGTDGAEAPVKTAAG